MTNRGTPQAPAGSRPGAFHRRLAIIFVLQLIAVSISVLMGLYNVAPLGAVFVLIVIVSVLAWLAARREWAPVSALVRQLDCWDEEQPDAEAFSPDHLSGRANADVVSLARGLHGFAERIVGYNQRERNFTRDASHELRSPLTVIKMSVDMLGEEEGLSDFGERSLQRIQRSARELEVLVEALLILAREKDNGVDEERFVVNDALRSELEFARDMLVGRPIQLELEEPARFALQGSPRVFAVLFWQLIRNACQQTERGRVVITVMPGSVEVSNHAEALSDYESVSRQPVYGADRHGFELAIAQRISDRFCWPLDLQTRPGSQNIARIRFPEPLPA